MKYFQVDFKITAPSEQNQDARDLLAAFLGEIEFETFDETDFGLSAYIQQPFYDEAALTSVLDTFPMEDVSISYNVTEAEEKDWNEVWENEGFEPIVIADHLTIHDGRHLPLSATPIMIEIDAKMAFGTGTHETTRMVIRELIDINMEGMSLLDCGCGTGILGIAALKTGATHVIGYDIDEWSVNNSRHNAIINRVDENFQTHIGDASIIASIEYKFDVVVANINRNILINDMPMFAKAMKPKATLVLSGFYTEDSQILIDRARTLGLDCIEEKNDNNWACLVFVKN